MMEFPLRIHVIPARQPLGVFYACVIKSSILLELTFSDLLRASNPAVPPEDYALIGTQRKEKTRKLADIRRFIETTEAAFPNSIIIGANYSQDGEFIEHDERWRVEEDDNLPILVIPTRRKLGSIIDGQHRLHAFEGAARNAPMDLLCSVYLDLPIPYQAYIFATINFNQTKVDRSLVYELFAIDLANEPEETWSPEKTAVFLCRKLNTDPDSPLYQHIAVAAQDSEKLFPKEEWDPEWLVSTATVVDGIMRLISSNPKRDRDELAGKALGEGRKRQALGIFPDESPLRVEYLESNDLVVYTLIRNYFRAVERTLWRGAKENSFIKKTVGVQALFDVLRSILSASFRQDKNLKEEYFEERLRPANWIDFANVFFQGQGRTRIRSVIEANIGLKDLPTDPNYALFAPNSPSKGGQVLN